MEVKPALLRWARERSGFTQEGMAHKLDVKLERIAEWERTGKISLPKLQSLASRTHTPIGYLFLSEPPHEKLPIPDFRTVVRGPLPRPSVDLLDVIHQCQQRQAWYRDYRIEEGAEPLAFVGSASIRSEASEVATSIRTTLKIDDAQSWSPVDREDAFRRMADLCEAAGLMIMRSSIVGSDTHRRLAVDEFRGFAMVDPYAPLIFINTNDAPTARMFTLAHELAHVWLGQSGVSDSDLRNLGSLDVERFCNRIAVEVLVPMSEFRERWQPSDDPLEETNRLAKQMNVSRLVLWRRARDAGLISDAVFREHYPKFAAFTRSGKGGGDFYASVAVRVGKRLASAVIERAFSGETTYTEAFHLLGVSSVDSLRKLATKIGIPTTHADT